MIPCKEMNMNSVSLVEMNTVIMIDTIKILTQYIVEMVIENLQMTTKMENIDAAAAAATISDTIDRSGEKELNMKVQPGGRIFVACRKNEGKKRKIKKKLKNQKSKKIYIKIERQKKVEKPVKKTKKKKNKMEKKSRIKRKKNTRRVRPWTKWFLLFNIMMMECLITPTLDGSRDNTKEKKETEKWKKNWMEVQNRKQDHYILRSRNMLTCPEWSNLSSKLKKK